jgi:translation initiation factor eIF-2B subunit alpha
MTKEALQKLGIASTLILDSSVGYVMSQVDYVLLGAEGVVESGGIVNKVCF